MKRESSLYSPGEGKIAKEGLKIKLSITILVIELGLQSEDSPHLTQRIYYPLPTNHYIIYTLVTTDH